MHQLCLHLGAAKSIKRSKCYGIRGIQIIVHLENVVGVDICRGGTITKVPLVLAGPNRLIEQLTIEWCAAIIVHGE